MTSLVCDQSSAMFRRPVGGGYRLRVAHEVTLLEVVVLEGEGKNGSVMREVTYYYRPDGELAAKHDPHPENAQED